MGSDRRSLLGEASDFLLTVLPNRQSGFCTKLKNELFPKKKWTRALSERKFH